MIETNVQEVRPKLWIGSLQGVTDTLRTNPSFFTHAVSCIEICPELRRGIAQLHIPVNDAPNESLLEHFNHVSEFILQAFKECGNVVVHCEQGISRSAALIAGHLIKEEHLNVRHALQAVYSARPSAQVNPWFVSNLLEWQLKQTTKP